MTSIQILQTKITIALFILIISPTILFGQKTFDQIRNEFQDEGFFLSTLAIININHIGQTNSASDLYEMGLLELFAEIQKIAGGNISERFAVIYFDLNNKRAGFVQSDNLRGIYERFIWDEELFKNTVVAAYNSINYLNSYNTATDNALAILNEPESHGDDAIRRSLNEVAAFDDNPYISSSMRFDSYLSIRSALQELDESLLERDFKLQVETFKNTFDNQLRINLGEDVHLIDLDKDIKRRDFSPAQLKRFESINTNVHRVIVRDANN